MAGPGYGFVYFLANQCMPGIFKIGFTTNHPKVRVAQLSGATACPTPFELVACFGVENPLEVEQEIHQDYDYCRLNSSREFFEISPRELQHIVHAYSDPVDDLVNTIQLDILVIDEAFESERTWLLEHFQSQCADPIFWPVKQEFKGFQ